MELCKIHAVNCTLHFDMTNGSFELKDREDYDLSWAKAYEVHNNNKYDSKLSYTETVILPAGSMTGKTRQGHDVAITCHKFDSKFWVYNPVQKLYKEVDFEQFCKINF